jgi:segregation and condensation protein A
MAYTLRPRMTEASPPASEPDVAETRSEADEAAHAPGVYRVQLPTFEGPLDLLLHLIEEHELDIRDIPIGFIAEKYVEYITLMEELNIDTASEYLVMAATLTHIKSKMLLPTPPQDQEDEEDAELDPRAELVRRLLEYQKYKHAAAALSSQDVLGRDVFPRGLPAPQVDGPAQIAGLSLFKLLDAFQAVVSRAKATLDHQIDVERFSISDRINELSDLLRKSSKLSFEELFVGARSRLDLVITFLALLEMTRLRLTRLSQDGPYEPICVELAVSDGESIIPGDGDPEGDADTLPAARREPVEASEDAIAETSEDALAHAPEDEATDSSEDEATPVPGEDRFDDAELDEIPTSPERDAGTE